MIAFVNWLGPRVGARIIIRIFDKRKQMHHVNSEFLPTKLAPHPCPDLTLKIELAVLLYSYSSTRKFMQRPATHYNNLNDSVRAKQGQLSRRSKGGSRKDRLSLSESQAIGR